MGVIMSFVDKLLDVWQSVKDALQPALSFTGKVFKIIGQVVGSVCRTVFRLRKILAAIPVGAGAVYLALYNETQLPKVVGIGLLENGTFTYQIAREIAVFTPVAITAVCLLLMFCSRRILTPWLVSAMTLLIPVVILITNIFPV